MSDNWRDQNDLPVDPFPEIPLNNSTDVKILIHCTVVESSDQNNPSAETGNNQDTTESSESGNVLQSRPTDSSEAASVSQNTDSAETENFDSFNNSEQLIVDNQPLAPMDTSAPWTANGNTNRAGLIKKARLVYKTQSEVAAARAQGRVAPVQTPFGSLPFMTLKPLPKDSALSFSVPSTALQNLFSERDQLMQENRNLNRRLLAFHRQLQMRKAC